MVRDGKEEECRFLGALENTDFLGLYAPLWDYKKFTVHFSDPHDPYNLNGEIIYTIDGEEYSITESTLIFLPKGLPHSPYRVVRVDKPIFHFAVLPERHFSQLMKVPEPDHKP